MTGYRSFGGLDVCCRRSRWRAEKVSGNMFGMADDAAFSWGCDRPTGDGAGESASKSMVEVDWEGGGI